MTSRVVDRGSLRKALLAVPAYWPIEAALQARSRGRRWLPDSYRFLREAVAISFPDRPAWATRNTVKRDSDTMWLRDFSDSSALPGDVPVIIDAPFAGHPSTIADYADGQSLVQTLKAAGCRRVYVTDWKSATHQMRDYGIDKYLIDLADAVDAVGGRAVMVGLCQGGWLSAMLAARFPEKVVSLVLAGAPIDAHAGDGPVTRMSRRLPLAYYQYLVAMGRGRMRGKFMLAGWKNMHPTEHYWGKFIDLYDNVHDPQYLVRARKFARWYEHTVDLPGRFYLQAVKHLFKRNRLARGEFVALGQRIALKSIEVPLYLLAGADDDITTPEQVFAAAELVGTPKHLIVSELAPGGHIGLFMGSRTLKEQWGRIASWILGTSAMRDAA